MSNLRSVNTKIWVDPWVENLSPTEKLLFIYLLTNSYTNIAGVYEITIKRISFETGIGFETVRKALKGFETVRKAYFIDQNYIFLPNWLKNQNLNANMKKGVIKIINELPKEVQIKLLGNGYITIRNDYITIRNALLNIEILEILELEVLEEEINNGSETINTPIPSFNEFLNHAKSKINDIDELDVKLKYDSWVENDWKDGNNKKITNWKSKLTNTVKYLNTKKNEPNKQNYQRRVGTVDLHPSGKYDPSEAL